MVTAWNVTAGNVATFEKNNKAKSIYFTTEALYNKNELYMCQLVEFHSELHSYIYIYFYLICVFSKVTTSSQGTLI